MKKIVSLLLTFSVLFSMTACKTSQNDSADKGTTPTVENAIEPSALATEPTTPTAEPTAPTEPAPTVFQHTFDTSLYGYFSILRVYGRTVDEELKIPVYPEEELLFKTISAEKLGRNAAAYNRSVLALESHYLHTYMKKKPNEVRVFGDCTSYIAYDTDTGYRLFLFFNPALGGLLDGYPILMNKNKRLPYEAFKDR